MIHVHSSLCAHSGVKRPAAYLWLVMLWSLVSDNPACLWPLVIQNVTLPVRPLHKIHKPSPPGVDRSEVGLAQINLQCLAYVQHGARGFKATKAGAGKKRKGKKEKTSFLGLSAWLHHQRYEILKNICLCLPWGKSACPLWCALKSVRIGRCHPPPCLTETCLCPDIAHLCTPQRPASLQPNTLSIQLATPQMAKLSTLYSPCALFLHNPVCHMQQHMKGVNW